MGLKEDGIEGERLLYQYLKNNTNVSFMFQADWIYEINGKMCIAEVKHQEYFKSPPFDGHGLPPYQVESRLKFQRDFGIRVVLYIFEKPYDKTGLMYWQYLDVLDNGKKYITNGQNKRVIYPIESFMKVTK